MNSRTGKHLWANHRRQIRRKVIDAHGMVCWLCGLAIDSMSELTMDHVTPAKDGGLYEPDNLRPAHSGCNKRRGHGPAPSTAHDIFESASGPRHGEDR